MAVMVMLYTTVLSTKITKQTSKWPGPGLGPSPGWGPVRVGAHMGPYGPIWVLLDRSGHDQIRTFGRIWYVSGPEMVF